MVAIERQCKLEAIGVRGGAGYARLEPWERAKWDMALHLKTMC